MDPERETAAPEGPMWLVRASLVLLFLAFAAFLAREVANVIERLT